VNIDRRGIVVTLHPDAVDDRLREDAVPVFFRGDVIDVVQQALIDQVV
jgi:hypothetical protein